uniref:HD_domain domain-containing protein n=1 Tax=Schistocephalus solidus TaxID=70667 RepID=A0A183SC36_SCHSO
LFGRFFLVLLCSCFTKQGKIVITTFDTVMVMKMAIIHDLAECIVGDLTPYCGVSVEEKHAQEEFAWTSKTGENIPSDTSR